MGTRQEDESNDEWASIAYSYEDVLLPRFQPLYDIIATIAVNKIKLNKKDRCKVLDYGTGPGEPLLTIMKLMEANEIFDVEFRGFDSSVGMISLAKQRFNKLNKHNYNVDFCSTNDQFDSNVYDIITSSLVLPYLSNKNQLLQEFFIQVKPKGMIISSHWPHPSQVPFLVVLKRVNIYMATDKRIDMSELESDISFSCWQDEITKEMFIKEGFIIEEWLPFHFQMLFPDIRSLLSFSRITPWFNNETLLYKAEQETKRILHEDYGFKLDFNGPFHLPTTAIVIIASK